jgi:hypothetical protein
MALMTKKRARVFKGLVESIGFWVLVVAIPILLAGFLVGRSYLPGLVEKFVNVSQPIFEPEMGGDRVAVGMKWLSTSGAKIVDEDRKEVILRGVNLPDFGWGGYDQTQTRAITVAVREWKVNVVRVRIYEERFFADSELYLSKLESEVVAPARSLGVYVILHPFLRDRVVLPTKRTPEMWKMIAQKYRNDPTVLYDPLDEPHDIDLVRVREAYQGLIELIRSINSKSLIIVTGLNWGREINPYVLSPLPYVNIVYRSNPYNEPDQFADVFGEAVGKLPVFLGEFGAEGYPPMSKEAVIELLGYADKNGISWTAWSFQNVGCPCLVADTKAYTPTAYGEIVRQALLRPR